MAALTAHADATLAQQEILKRYLLAVIDSCNCDAHFIVTSTPLYTAAIHNITNRPHESHTTLLRDRFVSINAVGLLRSQETNFYTIITNNRFIETPGFNVTHFHAPLLSEALLAEKTFTAEETSTDDAHLCAWTGLPFIIRDHWGRFSDQLRKHIMTCMKEFLQQHPDASAHTLDHSIFASTSQRQFPHIPVRQETGKIYDLMELLVSLDKVSLNTLIPATSENLKMRLNTTVEPTRMTNGGA